jgi:cell wall-associated NlpC family hydrolase
MVDVEAVVQLALAQQGDRYAYGAETNPNDPNPSAFDCSELVEWACRRAGVQPTMPDGSWI